MAGVADVDVVDLVAEDGEGRAMLALIEGRPWDDTSEEQERQLWTKLDNYMGYVESGQLLSDYAELAGRPVVFALHCAQEPTDKVMGILAAVQKAVQDRGVSVEYFVNPDVADEG